MKRALRHPLGHGRGCIPGRLGELHASIGARNSWSLHGGMPASDVSAGFFCPRLVLLLTSTMREVTRRQERTDGGFAPTRPCGRA